MASHKKNNLIILLTLLILCFGSKSFAQNSLPIFITPQYIQIQQSGSAIATVTGSNLNKAVIEVNGGDIYAFISEQPLDGNSLKINFTARPDAELGERQFLIRTLDRQEAKFILKVVPFGAPTIENIYPNTGNLGSTHFVQITGRGFIPGTSIVSSNEGLIINSFALTSDGSVLVLSLSVSQDIAPGTYPIFLNNPGGQAQGDFTVTNADSSNENTFNADPFSPGIYSIETSSQNKSQIIIKGSMFDPDPFKNTVTLLESTNGSTIGRQVEIISASNNEIIVNLPNDLSSESISFAVSSSNGKASNIKSIDLDSTATQAPDSAVNNMTVQQDSIASNTTVQIKNEQNQTNSPLNQQNTNTVIDLNTMSDSSDVIKPQESVVEKPEIIIEDINVVNNIKNISQYLFSNSFTDLNETSVPSVDKISDPLKVISTIEETKQIKNQVDLITNALQGAGNNNELAEGLQKAESLKGKVKELEKLLSVEKQKNRPDLRKVTQYQKLLTTTTAESRSQTFELLNKLLKYKPQLKNLLTQRPLDLATIQPNIPNDSAIIQYVPTEEGLIIFVVDNKNLKTRINKNISKDILSREIQSYKQLFENEIEKIKTTGRVTPIASWKNDKSNTYKKEIQPLKEKTIFLYNALIAPIEKDIENKKVLAIISNGWLRYLPFQSLAKPMSDGDLKFLISDKSIVYLDSVIALSKNQRLPLSSMSNVTIFANPDGTLQGANKEAEIITMLFGKTTNSLIQQPITISLINQLAKKADILHIATHGYFDASDINSSFLISGKKQNKNPSFNKIFLKDIYDLNLNSSKLVVLSGCDTGKIGSILNEPDDIVGSLATAFRVAGANTLLASLWKAHDDATKIIMQNFYENIHHGINKAEALRKAELKVKENPKYGHPLFWALFNLIGDWR